MNSLVVLLLVLYVTYRVSRTVRAQRARSSPARPSGRRPAPPRDAPPAHPGRLRDWDGDSDLTDPPPTGDEAAPEPAPPGPSAPGVRLEEAPAQAPFVHAGRPQPALSRPAAPVPDSAPVPSPSPPEDAPRAVRAGQGAAFPRSRDAEPLPPANAGLAREPAKRSAQEAPFPPPAPPAPSSGGPAKRSAVDAAPPVASSGTGPGTGPGTGLGRAKG